MIKYQLVIQFKASTVDDYDNLINLENELISILKETARVDGHDFGSGEANIFIITCNPQVTFQAIKKHLEKKDLLKNIRAAYREQNSDDYKPVWPEDSEDEFKVI